MLRLLPLLLLIAALRLPAADSGDPPLTPGQTFFLEFPHLAPALHSGTAPRLGVFLPDDYTPERTFPLMVWFGGGPGTDDPAPAVAMVGSSGFICAAVPYSESNSWKTDWPYYQIMLHELAQVVPNIDPARRACSGFSPEGSAIAYGMANSRGFQDYFHAFLPGGAGWTTGDYSRLRGRPVLVMIGQNDIRPTGLQDLTLNGKNHGLDLTLIQFEGSGALPPKYYPKLRSWLRENVVLHSLPKLVATMKSDFNARRFGNARRRACEVTFIADPDSPEHAAATKIIAESLPFGESEARRILSDEVPLAAKQQFIRDWQDCGFTAEVEAQCAEAAKAQLDRILTQNPVSPAHLKKFIASWADFPVCDQAMRQLEALANDELATVAEIQSSDARNYALKTFADQWKPSPSAERAARIREALAAEELEKIAAITAMGTKRAKLGEFIRNYAGTTAEQEARALQARGPKR